MNDDMNIYNKLKTQSLLKNQASNPNNINNPFDKNLHQNLPNSQLQNELYPSIHNSINLNSNTKTESPEWDTNPFNRPINFAKANSNNVNAVNNSNKNLVPVNSQKIQIVQDGMQNLHNAAATNTNPIRSFGEGKNVINPYENIYSNNNNNIVYEHEINNNLLNSGNPIYNQANKPVSNGYSGFDGNNTYNHAINLNNSNPNSHLINNHNSNSNYQNINNDFNNFNNPNFTYNKKFQQQLYNNINKPSQYQPLNSTLNADKSCGLPRQQAPVIMELPVILNTANSQSSPPNLTVRGNELGANAVAEEDKDGKHLCWIIALSLLFGFFAGFYFCYNFKKIKRKELAVGVFLAVCFIMTITHFLYLIALGKSSDLL